MTNCETEWAPLVIKYYEEWKVPQSDNLYS